MKTSKKKIIKWIFASAILCALIVVVSGCFGQFDFALECSKAISAAKVALNDGDTLVLDAQEIDAEFERVQSRAAGANLNDEQFANFREVLECGAGHQIYRSSSPFAKDERGVYCNTAAQNHSVKNVVYLLASGESQPELAGYCGQQNVRFFELNTDLSCSQNKATAREILQYLQSLDGNTLICDSEGATLTGYICAILQGIAGYTSYYQSVDWALSYVNLSNMALSGADIANIEANTPIAKANLTDAVSDAQFKQACLACWANMAPVFGVEPRQMKYLNPMRLAVNYLRGCGMSNDEICSLQSWLKECCD